MKKRFYLDTNIFVSLLIERDEKQDECKRLVEKIKANKIKAVTGNVVLAELIWVLKSFYGIKKIDVVEKIKGILRLRGLRVIDNYQLSKSVEIFEKKPVKYIDAMIASVEPIQEKKWVVVSFDKDFDKIGVLRKEPGEI